MGKLLNNLERGDWELFSIQLQKLLIPVRSHRGLGTIPACSNGRFAAHLSIMGLTAGTCLNVFWLLGTNQSKQERNINRETSGPRLQGTCVNHWGDQTYSMIWKKCNSSGFKGWLSRETEKMILEMCGTTQISEPTEVFSVTLGNVASGWKWVEL